MANERNDDDRDYTRRYRDAERSRSEEDRQGAAWRGSGRHGREAEPRAFSQDPGGSGSDSDHRQDYGAARRDDDRAADFGPDRDRFRSYDRHADTARRRPGAWGRAHSDDSADADFTSPYGGASGRGAYGEYRTTSGVSSGAPAFGHNPTLEHQAHGDFEHGPHRGKGPKNYVRSDDRIREDVSDRLSDDSHLDASAIEVTVVSGEVTLVGQVEDRRAKRRAEDCADDVSGVNHVQNNLRCNDRGGSERA
jgi:osmotically-inducible protein OsmY